MIDLIKSIPSEIFNVLGTVAGLTACAMIFIQVLTEAKSKIPSTLSAIALFGWIIIFLFWIFYGIHFGAFALWFSNTIAAILQTTLLILVIKKRNYKN